MLHIFQDSLDCLSADLVASTNIVMMVFLVDDVTNNFKLLRKW